ncbi:MAG: SpoIIIAH-like family protein [Negativicutes bacterium]|nr:SpoIIIAH-like family protein [Negativicutes bacterium]
MRFVVLTKARKWTVILAAFFVLCLLGAMMVNNYSSDRQAKADRSNAMQVVKPIVQEPAIPAASPDFFTEYRLERDKVRSERSDILRDLVKSAKSEDTRQRAQDSVLKLILEKQREMEMENLIKARGFSDALVLIRDNSVSAIIKTNSLTREEVMQVADIISRVSGVKAEDITISAKP